MSPRRRHNAPPQPGRRWALLAALLVGIAAAVIIILPRGGGDRKQADDPTASRAEIARELQSALERRSYIRAEQLATSLTRRNPDDVQALAALGVVCLETGRAELAESHLRRCLEVGTETEAQRRLIDLELSRALERTGRLREAIERLVAILLDDPYERRAYLDLARCLARLGRQETARAFLDVARTLEPGDGDDRLASEYQSTGRPAIAARYRAQACRRRGQIAKGLNLLRAAAGEGPPALRVYLAEYLLETGSTREAHAVLRSLMEELGASHPDVMGWAAMAMESEGESEMAAGLLTKLCNEVEGAAGIWALRLAAILIDDLSRPDAALEWLELYLSKRPSAKARALLGEAHFRMGDLEAAEEELGAISPEALRSLEGDHELRLTLVRARLRTDLDRAGRTLADLRGRRSYVPLYHLALAEWLEAGGDLEDLGKRYGETTREDLLGRARKEHARLSRLEKAAEELWHKAKTASETEAAGSLCAAARIRLEMEDREEALRLARIATARAPQEAEPWRLLEEWLDTPAEAFLREEARRQLAALSKQSTSAPLSAKTLIDRWDVEKSLDRYDHVVQSKRESRPEAEHSRVKFVDATKRSGIDFTNVCGSPKKDYILEMNGGGVAFLDYDLDGRLDVFLVNGSKLPPPHGEGVGPTPPTDRLYRNLGGLRFEDVTRQAGLVESSWGCGVAVGDYDNDGDPDIFVTNHGPDRLWRNNGDGTFSDATLEAGTDDPRWGSSCAFLDFDRDGHLDLFVVNYLAFDPDEVPRRGIDPDCQYRGLPIACGPAGLPPVPCTLYRGRGDGTFEDVSESCGVRDIDLPSATYGLGVTIIDYDLDGWLDLYVANDTRSNLLFRNRADGTFEDVAMLAGVSLDATGNAQSGMGVDAVFLDGGEAEDLFVVNYENDANTYYRNTEDGFFDVVTGELGLLEPCFQKLGWGTFFFDADLDGDLDLFVANGHVIAQAEELPSSSGYRQQNTLFLNHGSGRFHDASDEAGDGLLVRKSSRGAAFGDLDGDGDLDIVVNEIDERATLLENAGRPEHHWLGLRLRGTDSNRDGIGAVVTLKTGGRVQRWRVRSGSSYASQSELTARFGLGEEESVEELRIHWPRGEDESFPVAGVDRVVELIEGEGS